ncbi:MAG: hypothetical protein ACKO8Z_07935, partial [Prosthecobacter sp.]
LYSMPEEFEQWATWGVAPKATIHGKIQRIGINIGAPGDRKTRDGTLWLDFPSVGGPSPEIDFITEPVRPDYFYQHSLWMKKGSGWPWVAASGAKGLRSAQLSGLRNGCYTVKFVFSSPDSIIHRFEVAVQNRVMKVLQPQTMLASTETFSDIRVTHGMLTFTFTPQEGETLLSGIEVIRTGD